MEVIIFIVAVIIYFIPGLVGNSKRDATAIWLLNFFLGWTFIGWIAALIWASTSDPERPTVIVSPQTKANTSAVDQLTKLKGLLDAGAISQTEYDKEKQRDIRIKKFDFTPSH